MVVLGQGGFIWHKCLYSGKEDVYGQTWLYAERVVLFGQKCCSRKKWLYREKRLYSCKLVVFGQEGL